MKNERITEFDSICAHMYHLWIDSLLPVFYLSSILFHLRRLRTKNLLAFICGRFVAPEVSGQKTLDGTRRVDVGQALVAAVVRVGEPAEVEAEEVEDGGVEVGHARAVDRGAVAEVVGGAM